MYSSAEDLVTSLERNDPGSSRTSPSRLPRMLVENQPVDAQQAGLEAGRQQGLHEGLAALDSPCRRWAGSAFARQFQQCRHVGGHVRRAVGVRHARFERGVGVDLAGRDFGIVVPQPLLEGLEGGVYRGAAWWKTSVEPHQIMTVRVTPVLFFELPDIVHHASRHNPSSMPPLLMFGPLMRLTNSGRRPPSSA